MMIPRLSAGNSIGILSTARAISFQEIERAISEIELNGFIPVVGKTIGMQANVFAGNDNFRAAELQEFLDDSKISAILFARGGYGTIRILDKINFTHFMNHPKWLCGFSDITILHAHVNDKLGLPTVHSVMPFNFQNTESESIQSLFRLLKGDSSEIIFPSQLENKQGVAEGILIGGNLSILYSLLGTRYGFNTSGKILFLEDVDEYLYHIDRMLVSLKLAGKLQFLKGIIVGGFTQIKDNAIPFGKTVEQIFNEHTADLNIPVCFQFPAGHTRLNRAFILGKHVQLTVANSGCKLVYI